METQIRLNETKTYTMRELNQRTARVLEEINDSGSPAVITRHGRFIALVTPLRGAAIEAMVLSHGRLADFLHERATEATPATFTPSQIQKQIHDRHS